MLYYFNLIEHISKTHLFITSFMIFISINLIENLIHYSIGRESDKKIITYIPPTKIDWIRIIIIMIVFAILQSSLTCYFNGCK